MEELVGIGRYASALVRVLGELLAAFALAGGSTQHDSTFDGRSREVPAIRGAHWKFS
jgi:hypothetical protein